MRSDERIDVPGAAHQEAEGAGAGLPQFRHPDLRGGAARGSGLELEQGGAADDEQIAVGGLVGAEQAALADVEQVEERAEHVGDADLVRVAREQHLSA